MTKSELLERLRQEYPNYSKRQLLDAVDIIFGSIVEAVEEGRRVELRGFGVFSHRLHHLPNPKKTQAAGTKDENIRRIPFFRQSKNLLERLNKKK